MKLTFEISDKGTSIHTEGSVAYDELIAGCMGIMEYATEQYTKKLSQQDREDLYDALDAIFYRFMEKAFPDVQPRDFDFSDAALLFAQDMIINKAKQEGKSFEEIMKELEAEAKAYVQKKGKLA